MVHYKTLRQQLDEIPLKEENIERIMSVLMNNSQIQVPHVGVKLTPDIRIYRARPHDPRNVMATKRDVSYPPNPARVKMGRANMRGNQVFYGAVNSKEVREGYIPAMQEASQIRYGWIPPIQTFTVSQWKPRRTVEIPTFVTSKVLASGMETAREIYGRTEEMINALAQVDQPRVRELFSVLHDEFTKEVNSADDYLISAVFSSIMYQYGYGISYPSKRSDYKAFNIAVPASNWEADFELLRCGVFQYHATGKDVIVRGFKHTISPDEPFEWEATPIVGGPLPFTPPEFQLHPYPLVKPT